MAAYPVGLAELRSNPRSISRAAPSGPPPRTRPRQSLLCANGPPLGLSVAPQLLMGGLPGAPCGRLLRLTADGALAKPFEKASGWDA